MRMLKVFIFLCVAVAVALFCSGFQKIDEQTRSHVYRTMDGDINDIATYYYKFNDKDVVGTLDDYQTLVRVYNRDKLVDIVCYKGTNVLRRRQLVKDDVLTIPIRKLKK